MIKGKLVDVLQMPPGVGDWRPAPLRLYLEINERYLCELGGSQSNDSWNEYARASVRIVDQAFRPSGQGVPATPGSSSETLGSGSLPSSRQSSAHVQHREPECDDFGTTVTEVTTVATREVSS